MRQGQSLVELIVAMAIASILIVGGVAAILPILKTTTDVGRIQAASALGKELLDNVRVLAEGDWHVIDAIPATSARRSYLIATSSPFTVASGTESVAISTTTYTRFFYLEDVFRSPTNPYAPVDIGGSPDPSTKKITVVYAWPPNASNTIVSYLTRARNEAYFMTDWSGGGNQAAAVTATSSDVFFATSSNIDYIGTTGSVVISGY